MKTIRALLVAALSLALLTPGQALATTPAAATPPTQPSAAQTLLAREQAPEAEHPKRVPEARPEGVGVEAVDDDIPGTSAPSSPISGSLDSSYDTSDVYNIWLTAGTTITMSLNGAYGTDFDLYLYSPGTPSVSYSSVAKSNYSSYPESVTYSVPTSGYYYMEAYAYSGYGSYTLSYSTSSGSSPDLTATSASMPSPVAVGAATTLSQTLRNNGSTSSGIFEVEYYLSTDSTLDYYDEYLGYTTQASLGAYTSRSATYNLDLPEGMSAGTYRVIIVVDSAMDVTETNESNNTYVGSTVTLTTGGGGGGAYADLSASGMSVAGPVQAGNQLAIGETLKNTSSSSTSGFRVSYYLSTDGTIGSDDVSLGTVYEPGLAAGASRWTANSFTVPANTTPTRYWVAAVVDSWGEVGESNESNNTLFGGPIDVVAPVPTTYTLQVQAPSSSTSGESTWFSAYWSQNVGSPANKTLILERKPLDSYAWSEVARATTDYLGNAQLVHSADVRADYRVRTDFNGAWVYSAVSRVETYADINMQAPSSVGLKKTFTVSGYMSPRKRSGAKTVLIRCYRGGKLRKTVRATNYNYTASDGRSLTRYRARLSLSRAGSWTLIAYCPQDSLTLGTWSNSKTVAVNKTRISIHTNGVWTTYARSATVSSTLRNRSGKPISGKVVRLQKWSGGHWSTVKKIRTNSRGHVSYKVKPKYSTGYRFYYPGSSKLMSSYSDWQYVVSNYEEWSGYSSYTNGWWVRTSWFKKGYHQVKLYASDGVGRVYLEKSDGTWRKYINTRRIPGSKTKTFRVKLPSEGSYRIGWKDNYGYSNYFKFTVW